MNTEIIQRKIDRLIADYRTSKSLYTAEKESLKEAKTKLHDVQKVQQVAQVVAQQVQQSAHKQIASVVATCLKAVFGGAYNYRIDFVRKRGRTEAKLVLVKNGHDVEDPIEQDSGGVLDASGLAQLVSCLRLHKPGIRQILLLDEPFKNLHSKKYRKRVREFIEKLSRDFKIQIILVTGISDFECGKVIRL